MRERENVAPQLSKSPKRTKYALILMLTIMIGAEAKKLGLPEAHSSAVTHVRHTDIDENLEDTQRVESLQQAKEAMSSMSGKIGLVMAGRITWNFSLEQNRTPGKAALFIRTMPSEDQEEVKSILRHLSEYPDDQDNLSSHCLALLNESTVGATLSPIFMPILRGKGDAQSKANQTLKTLEALDILDQEPK